ncbi:MAG: hypothetical protein CFE45_05100 [Burkholderiales bacterium PBB5]|nr:MAG: hypothetical protein CFE45_05100 [Burkholderiales bacterium PBB5]
MPRMGEITALIQQAGQGSDAAIDRLYELLYADLRRIAHGKLRLGDGPRGLNTTALVHESYLRLIKLDQLDVKDRGHFLTYAAKVMRSVVVDLVREARADRRGVDQRLVQVVEMRFFVGLEMDEIAQALGVAKRTVERDWEKARSFLYVSLKAD